MNENQVEITADDIKDFFKSNKHETLTIVIKCGCYSSKATISINDIIAIFNYHNIIPISDVADMALIDLIKKYKQIPNQNEDIKCCQ